MPQQAIVKDIEFLKMITKGHASAYTISAFMKKQAETEEKQPIISYSNIAERMLRLFRDGLIEEVQIDGKRSIHGRKDYRLTSVGIRALMTNIDALNEDDIKPIMDYFSKAYGDDREFGEILVFTYLLANLDNTLFFIETFTENVNTPKLIPLKRALIKDLASFKFKELAQLYKSGSLAEISESEPMFQHAMELPVVAPTAKSTTRRKT
ncbi:MAG: hypothetical protein ACRD8W_32670 [Nitrososphaeraceae archaeon]